MVGRWVSFGGIVFQSVTADDLSKDDIICLCFRAGTLIKSPAGDAPIESIVPGDQVWARDEITGEWALAEVVEVFSRDYEGDIVTVEVEGESIEATGSHPFWVIDGDDLDQRPAVGHCEIRRSVVQGRWVEARNLRAGDTLASHAAGDVAITQVCTRHDEIRTFNLQIAKLQTYAVGSAGIWVHNASGKGKSSLCGPQKFNKRLRAKRLY